MLVGGGEAAVVDAMHDFGEAAFGVVADPAVAGRVPLWRGINAAILPFIRNKNVTAVINKGTQKIENHPNIQRRASQRGDDITEFTMQAQDHPAPEIHLAQLPSGFAPRPPTQPRPTEG